LQANPPVPQASLLPASWQTPFSSQQPPGQDAGVHTHLPCALHSCFGAHIVQTPPPAPQLVALGLVLQVPLAQHPAQAPPPQLQAPLEQLCPVAHVPHALPPEPHAIVVCSPTATHFFPAQHPVGQDAFVHSHTPAALQA
jgi:hypothetical protein